MASPLEMGMTKEISFSRNGEDYKTCDLKKQTVVVLQLWPGKIPVFPRRKRRRKVAAAEFVVGQKLRADFGIVAGSSIT